MKTRKTFPPVKNLHADSIDMEPISFDWSANTLEPYRHDDSKGLPWSFWEAVECDKCGRVVILQNGSHDETHSDVEPTIEVDGYDEPNECDGNVPYSEGPQMNYWYPIEHPDMDADDMARAISHLPLCVVEVDGVMGLALTGGGQDLSWEICEAFIWIGQLPPIHFADLPRMAGRGTSAHDRFIIRAALKSTYVKTGRLESLRARLKGFQMSAVVSAK